MSRGSDAPVLTYELLKGCTFPIDPHCVGNCLSTSLCDSSFTKQCEDGNSVVQKCPADVTMVDYESCGRGNACKTFAIKLSTLICNHAHSCILLTPLLLHACHNVNRFVASSLFLCRVIFPYSYRILLLC